MSQRIPDLAELRSHISSAEVPALLMTIAHMTGDASVLRPEWKPNPASLPHSGLSAEVEAEARDYALSRLAELAEANAEWPDRPSPELLHAMGTWGIGPDAGTIGGLLEGALVMDGEDPSAPAWSADELAPDRHLTVAIVGTGFSGLMAALRVKQAGLDFTVFEKGVDVGGTWWENTYPDCRTDVHSHIYTYSFFQQEWPSYFSRQHVIMEYLQRFARENGLYEHMRFGTTVQSATWQEDEQSWLVRTTSEAGEQEELFTVLISGVGQLNRPSIPNIPGAETFAGPAYHSAQWDHSVDLTGKKVAVVGTGASALQFAPAAARVAEHVTIFQRTPPWLMPTPELRQDVPEDERWLLRELPLFRAYYRFSIFLPRAVGQLDAATVDLDYPPTEHAISAAGDELRQMLTDSLMSQLDENDPLIEHVIPNYPPGAKRIIRDDGTWIKTLKRDNVSIISDGIDRIDETGLWTSEGNHIEADVILYGTGFAASDFLMPMTITGIDGKDLHEYWGGDARAFYGLTVPGFPNMFTLYGPNTNLVLHGNVVFFMERQANYITESIKLLLSSGARSMDVREDVFDEHVEMINQANRLRAWGWSGVNSWYKNASGRSVIMWPLPAQDYFDATTAPDPAHYHLDSAALAGSTSSDARSAS